MEIVPGGIEAQTAQALANFKAVVEASGSEIGKVVKTTVCSAAFRFVRGRNHPQRRDAGVPQVDGRLRDRQRPLR